MKPMCQKEAYHDQKNATHRNSLYQNISHYMHMKLGFV